MAESVQHYSCDGKTSVLFSPCGKSRVSEQTMCSRSFSVFAAQRRYQVEQKRYFSEEVLAPAALLDTSVSYVQALRLATTANDSKGETA
jgi:hypothetical protein